MGKNEEHRWRYITLLKTVEDMVQSVTHSYDNADDDDMIHEVNDYLISVIMNSKLMEAIPLEFLNRLAKEQKFDTYSEFLIEARGLNAESLS